MDSKAFSWRFVTKSGKLTGGPCELVAAELVPSAATTDTALYDGDSASGDLIVILKQSTVDNYSFVPPVPIACYRGIYITVGSNVTGVLVQWRDTQGE